ncbi:glycosyltransferase family 90 protein, partial [Amniculicola lignicola CBS 123094]
AHPIAHLIARATLDFKKTVAKQPQSLSAAASQYRKLRRRHPPPGFAAWYAFAVDQGALIPEEFFDQIYHDLGPFWGLDPRMLAKQAHAQRTRISIRDGKMVGGRNGNEKLDMWRDMLGVLAQYRHVTLPDVDIPLNTNEEPALIVPWEDIATTMEFTRPLKLKPGEVLDEFSPVDDDKEFDKKYKLDVTWLTEKLHRPAVAVGLRTYWSLLQPACAPNSPTRKGKLMADIWHMQGHTREEHLAAHLLPPRFPNGSVDGYVGNWSQAIDPCQYPYLQGLHGAFVRPEQISTSQKMFPLFSGSKMSINNDILVPRAEEWNATYGPLVVDDAPGESWSQRESKLFWRGPATGGTNTKMNWNRFHRHRFVSMCNGSHVEAAEQSIHDVNTSTSGISPAGTFRLHENAAYRLTARKERRLADWLHLWADVAFTDLKCFDEAKGKSCPYNSAFYSLARPESAEGVAKSKYTAILDGGSEDGREFVKCLQSGSVALRASVSQSWYDARLWPWMHFVPMDNTFVDLYGIMEYFVGSGNGEEKEAHKGHDDQARRIATAGREWALKALRREDMLVYVYRLVLEYRRVLDVKRERLGYAGDL